MLHVSPTARNVVPCPFCKELITKGAARCPHCHSNLVIPRKRKKRPFMAGNFMMGIYVATVFWLVIIIIYLSKS